MLTAKVLHTQQGGDVLTGKMKEQVIDERFWSQKLLKRYRVMRKLEKRKYHGGYFAQDFRTLTSYFAGKHLLGPDVIDENISAYSGEASKMSQHSPRDIQSSSKTKKY